MNNILDRDDLTIMKRAIFSTQVIRKKAPTVSHSYKILSNQYFNLLECANLEHFWT